MVLAGEKAYIGGDPEEELWAPVGENPGIDLTDPFAKHTNRQLISYGSDPNTVITIPEIGDVAVKDIRVWRSKKPGELITFIRQEAGEHRVITSTILALGVVATAVAAVKHNSHK